MAERHRIEFDFRNEYWRLPERRLLLAYFAKRWTGRSAPPSALRAFAVRAFRFFDAARAKGVVSYIGVDYDGIPGGFAQLCSTLADYVDGSFDAPEWQSLRAVWQLKVKETAAGDIAAFMRDAAKSDKWEPALQNRFPWFGYVGVKSEEELAKRQAFFYGYANLWTTCNAYKVGGGLEFAPLIQNTPTGRMLDTALLWSQGNTLDETGFRVIGKTDADNETQDRSHFSVVHEIYGFLKLERMPFYNSRVERYREWFQIPQDIEDPLLITQAVGKATLEWLSGHPENVDYLSRVFRKAIEEPWSPRVEFEEIASPSKQKDYSNERLPLFQELRDESVSELSALDKPDAAAIILHFLLDAEAYNGPAPAHPKTQPSLIQNTKVSPSASPVHASGDQEPDILPDALRPSGEEALKYLRLGFHVLFAGAPGTGKTMLAQFVASAWNKGAASLADELAAGDKPITTVANSAWSPFHTIGGFVPKDGSGFDLQPGIFIDDHSIGGSMWHLRNECVVLDEMNRADLDRCIGDLYPLLSGTVDRVRPAGLGRVTEIRLSDRFRIIATVNDAHLDDVVFPISDGLARRFLRIELPGASEDEVLSFLSVEGPLEPSWEHKVEAKKAIRALFDFAREKKLNLSGSDDSVDRLPIGVGYFKPLRAWLNQRFGTATQDDALKILMASLSSWKEMRRCPEAQKKLEQTMQTM